MNKKTNIIKFPIGVNKVPLSDHLQLRQVPQQTQPKVYFRVNNKTNYNLGFFTVNSTLPKDRLNRDVFKRSKEFFRLKIFFIKFFLFKFF